jgi:hypothetical protein
MSLRHSYDPMNVSHGHGPCGSLAVAIALMQNLYWWMLLWLSGIKNNGVMGFLIRTRFWYLAAFGTSYCGNTLDCTPSATACQWACCLIGPRIDANDTYCITVNQNVDTHTEWHAHLSTI